MSRFLLAAWCAASLAAAAPPVQPRLDDIFARWVAAEGGPRAVASLAVLDTDEQVSAGDAAPWLQHAVQTRDGRFRWEASDAGGNSLVNASDGHLAWISEDRLGFGLVPAERPPAWLRPDDIWFSQDIGRAYPDRRLLPDGGPALWRVAMNRAATEREIWSFDRSTGHLVSVDELGADAAVAKRYEYADFREQAGLVLPFSIRVHSAKGLLVVTREALRINGALDPGIFAPPPRQLDEARQIQAVLDRNRLAVGRPRAGVKTRVIHRTEDETPTGVRSQTTISLKLPERILIETVTPGLGTRLEGYDGATGWSLSDIQGFRELTADECLGLRARAIIHGGAERFDDLDLRRDLGLRLVNGHSTRAISLGTPAGPVGVFCFDTTSGQLIQWDGAVVRDAATSLAVTIEFDDYRAVDGEQIPYMIIQRSPATESRARVDSIQDNVPLDDAIFKPRRADAP
jgi:hypothetical protein